MARKQRAQLSVAGSHLRQLPEVGHDDILEEFADTVVSLLKLVEPAIRFLLERPFAETLLDALLLGH